MEFNRKEKKYEFLLPLFLLLSSLGLVYLCYDKMDHWAKWLLILCLLMLGLSFYKSLKNVYKKIVKLTFSEETVEVFYKNGSKEILDKEKLSYALLVKKFIDPLREIQIQEVKKKRFGKTKSKSLGTLKTSNWEALNPLAEHLLKNNFTRNEYAYSIGFFELMGGITLFFLGAAGTAMITESYIDGFSDISAGVDSGIDITADNNIVEPLMRMSDASAAVTDEIEKERKRSRESDDKSKKKFLDKIKFKKTKKT